VAMGGTLLIAEFIRVEWKCCIACSVAFVFFAISFGFGAPVLRLITSFLLTFMVYKVFSHPESPRQNESPRKKRMVEVKSQQ